MKNAVKGFTLIEALIVMVIVSILATIAYPSYVAQMRKTIRTEAATELMALAQAQEQYFAQFRTYASTVTAPEGCAGQACGLGRESGMSENGHYKLSSNGDAAAYTLTATAEGTQEDDLDCRTMSIDNAGIKRALSASGQNTTSTCW